MTVDAIWAVASVRRNYRVELALRPEAVREAHRLRYQVFCTERGIFQGECGIESDTFDVRSHHVLLRRRRDNEVIGTTRLVLPSREAPSQSLPMQRVADAGIFRGVPLLTTGEISRFALSKQRAPNRQADCLARLGLVRGILQLSRALGLSHWCAAMEPGLLRLLGCCGIHFDVVGDVFEYHGLRQPVVGAIDQILERGRQERPDFWDYVTASGSFCRTMQPVA